MVAAALALAEENELNRLPSRLAQVLAKFWSHTSNKEFRPALQVAAGAPVAAFQAAMTPKCKAYFDAFHPEFLLHLLERAMTLFPSDDSLKVDGGKYYIEHDLAKLDNPVLMVCLSLLALRPPQAPPTAFQVDFDCSNITDFNKIISLIAYINTKMPATEVDADGSTLRTIGLAAISSKFPIFATSPHRGEGLKLNKNDRKAWPSWDAIQRTFGTEEIFK